MSLAFQGMPAAELTPLLLQVNYLGKRGGFVQMLDDCGPKMTFAHADIYSGKGIKLGQERILHHVILPYRLVRSSKGYSYYERIDNEEGI